MIFSSNPLFNSLKVYIIIIILLVYFKPNFIYDNQTKKFRQFGTNKGNTIFSLPVLSIFLAVLLYIIFLSIDKLNNTNKINKSNNNFSIQLPIQSYPIQTIPQIQTIPIIQPMHHMQFNPQYYPQYNPQYNPQYYPQHINPMQNNQMQYNSQ
jgi:hypothetical protein